MKEFENRTALITGAAHGFGVEMAKEAANRKMKLFLVDIDQPALEKVSTDLAETAAEVATLVADLTTFENVQKMVEAANQKFGGIDLLINNAGIYFEETIWDMPLRDYDWMRSINLDAPIYTMHEVMPDMIRRQTPCHIVNISSISGIITHLGKYAYHATKHGLLAASEAILYDMNVAGITNIGMTVVCPGYYQTDLHHHEEHRPEAFTNIMDTYYESDKFAARQKFVEEVITAGKPLEGFGPLVFEAIENDQFYLLPDGDLNDVISRRTLRILGNVSPHITIL